MPVTSITRTLMLPTAIVFGSATPATVSDASSFFTPYAYAQSASRVKEPIRSHQVESIVLRRKGRKRQKYMSLNRVEFIETRATHSVWLAGRENSAGLKKLFESDIICDA